MEDLKDIWDVTDGAVGGFLVLPLDADNDCMSVDKNKHDWESAWTKLNQISAMTEDEFIDAAMQAWPEFSEDSFEDSDSEGGESEEEVGEEEEDGDDGEEEGEEEEVIESDEEGEEHDGEDGGEEEGEEDTLGEVHGGNK